MSNSPKVTIIILNWNGASDTLALLENLKSVAYDNFSVLVVDNASQDDSLGQLARFMEQHRAEKEAYPLSLLPLSQNFGFAEGNNKGVAQANRERGDYYLLLNNDTIVSPDFLTKLVAVAEADETIGAVGPTIYFADKNGKKSKAVWYAGGWLNFAAGGGHHHTQLPTGKDEIIRTQFITGCSLLLKRAALAKLGQLFDTAFFAYGEDVDLSIRLQKAGFDLGYVPSATIWHKLATSSGGPKSSNFWYYNVRNNFLLLGRYATWLQRVIFLFYFLFYKPVLWSIGGLIVRPRIDKFHRLVAIAQGSFDALRHRYGKRP
jgi:GT2 family glycosyltransferase